MVIFLEEGWEPGWAGHSFQFSFVDVWAAYAVFTRINQVQVQDRSVIYLSLYRISNEIGILPRSRLTSQFLLHLARKCITKLQITKWQNNEKGPQDIKISRYQDLRL